jgi:hypothetical protein
MAAIYAPTAGLWDDFCRGIPRSRIRIPGGEANNIVNARCNVDRVIARMPDCFVAPDQAQVSKQRNQPT